jgi:cyclic 2,3-diphosphoglycerate synthetase
MTRVVALIDGEHYPPVVRFALANLAYEHDVVAAAFLGGTEKVDVEAGMDTYGVPIVTADTAEQALTVVSAADRFRLAGIALAHGVEYRGADFVFKPPRARLSTHTPTLGLVGTGKRVGKTAVSGFVARSLAAAGRDICVLAMGRGGPEEPELIHGESVSLTVSDLLELAAQGKHASSDNYEDAVMSRVTTVGCRRCGGGMAGETFFSNVPEGARLADSLGKELIVLEGSGAAVPPVHADANILVVGAGRGLEYVRDFFGPFRLGQADLVIIASAEEPIASPMVVAEMQDQIARIVPDTPCVATTFRPAPVEPVDGARVFFATTAPEHVLPKLTAHLESEYGCDVVASSANLSNRALLRQDMAAAGHGYDLLLTELKAAAIDVVAAAGREAGVPTVLCDNVPVSLDGADLTGLIAEVAGLALSRGTARRI